METSQTLRQLVLVKVRELHYILETYNKAKNDYQNSFSLLFSENLSEIERQSIDQTRNEATSRLRFFYQDFFIHSVILCDLIARMLTGNQCESFPQLFNKPELIPTQYMYAVQEFNPIQKKIRYWRNKLIIHSEIIHYFGGSIRSHPEKGIEFLSISRKNIEESDVKFLYLLRDRYGVNSPELQKESNVWEILILFDSLSIPLAEEDRNWLHSFRIKYGSLLPRLEIYEPMIINFCHELGLD
jgi:hypothetical protein